jgi:hypothetical protein
MIALGRMQECFHLCQLLKHGPGFANVEDKYFHISDCDRRPPETILDGTDYNKFLGLGSGGALRRQRWSTQTQDRSTGQ